MNKSCYKGRFSNNDVEVKLRDRLVGCFGLNGLLRQHPSLYQAVSQREGERGEKG